MHKFYVNPHNNLLKDTASYEQYPSDHLGATYYNTPFNDLYGVGLMGDIELYPLPLMQIGFLNEHESKKDLRIELGDEIVSKVKSGKALLVFDHSNELHDFKLWVSDGKVKEDMNKFGITDYTWSIINNTLDYYDIPDKQSIAIVNSEHAMHYDTRYHTCHLNLYEQWHSIFNPYMATHVQKIKNKQTRANTIRCLNFRPTLTRLKIANHFFENSWLEKSLFTLHAPWGIMKQALPNLDLSDDFIDSLPWEFDLGKDERRGYAKTFGKDFNYTCLNSYVTLAIESHDTLVDINIGNHRSVTDKTFPSIERGMPFIIMSMPGSLKYLHSLGYKTFSNYWDESYDDEEDYYVRRNKVLKACEGLISMSSDKLDDMLYDMLPILIHNAKLFRENVRTFHHARDLHRLLDEL